jgi:hypothetical protein
MKDVIAHFQWHVVSLSQTAVSKLLVEFESTAKQRQRRDVIVTSLPWDKQNLMPRGDQLITKHRTRADSVFETSISLCDADHNGCVTMELGQHLSC